MDPFALAYREQQQLFLYDSTYLSDTLFQIGGLSTLISRFIVQFFRNPYVAESLCVMFLLISALLLWMVVRRSRRDWIAILPSAAPSFLLAASVSDSSLQFDYLISVICVESALLIYRNIRSHRFFYGILLTVLSYIAAGPIAFVFGIGAAFLYAGQDGADRRLAPAFTLTALLCGVVTYCVSLQPSLYDALTPSFHYRLDTAMPAIHYIPWIALALVCALCSIRMPRKLSFAIYALTAVISAIGAASLTRKVESKSELASCELEYYTVNERWDDLVEACRHHPWSPATANYLNLAFARKGCLCDYLMKYDNRGVSSLLTLSQLQSADVRVAHIMFAMGNIAAAQNVAFNTMFTVEGYAPAMLKMNVLCEMARGSYAVADKYVSLLEKTLSYRAWAQSMRRFLYNDAAVEADPLLGTARRDFPEVDGFAMFDSPLEELLRVVDANPSDAMAMQYALAFLLLSRDISRLYTFVSLYWGTPALSGLPSAAQEALIFYSEYTRNFTDGSEVPLEWCVEHGVTRETLARFRSYQNACVRSGSRRPAGYEGTYWNYLVNTQQ